MKLPTYEDAREAFYETWRDSRPHATGWFSCFNWMLKFLGSEKTQEDREELYYLDRISDRLRPFFSMPERKWKTSHNPHFCGFEVLEAEVYRRCEIKNAVICSEEDDQSELTARLAQEWKDEHE